MTPEEEIKILKKMEDVYKADEERLKKIAPRCHFRPMILMDYNDGDNAILHCTRCEAVAINDNR